MNVTSVLTNVDAVTGQDPLTPCPSGRTTFSPEKARKTPAAPPTYLAGAERILGKVTNLAEAVMPDIIARPTPYGS